MYGDGVNIHAYVQSNPSKHQDPNGLDYADDAIAEYVQQVAGVYETLSQAKAAAFNGSRLSQAYTQMAFAWDDLVWDRDEAILFDLAIGPLLSKMCFVAGTPIILADGSKLGIEQVALGQRVFTESDGSHHARSADTSDPDAYDEIDPASWKVVSFCIDDSSHGSVKISLLRPSAWLNSNEVHIGGSFKFDLPDMGIDGVADVVAISECPSVSTRVPESGVVTGLFVTTSAKVVDLWLEGFQSPIGVTVSHPFYSCDKGCWTAAASLSPGERIRTLGGTVRVERVDATARYAQVFNFEVQRTHTYYVGEAALWAHNGCHVSEDVLNAGGRGKTGRWPACQVGEEVYAAATHGHAYDLAKGGAGKVASTAPRGAIRGWVEFIGDAWKFIADPW